MAKHAAMWVEDPGRRGKGRRRRSSRELLEETSPKGNSSGQKTIHRNALLRYGSLQSRAASWSTYLLPTIIQYGADLATQVIAQAGIASRRKAEELVQSGVVRVNSKQITVPQHMVLPSIDEVGGRTTIEFEGELHLSLRATEMERRRRCADYGGRQADSAHRPAVLLCAEQAQGLPVCQCRCSWSRSAAAGRRLVRGVDRARVAAAASSQERGAAPPVHRRSAGCADDGAPLRDERRYALVLSIESTSAAVSVA